VDGVEPIGPRRVAEQPDLLVRLVAEGTRAGGDRDAPLARDLRVADRTLPKTSGVVVHIASELNPSRDAEIQRLKSAVDGRNRLTQLVGDGVQRRCGRAQSLERA